MCGYYSTGLSMFKALGLIPNIKKRKKYHSSWSHHLPNWQDRTKVEVEPMGTHTKRNRLPCPGEELVEPAGVIWISAIQHGSHQLHEEFKLCMYRCNFFRIVFNFVLWDRISLCSLGLPWTHNPLTSWVLRLQVYGIHLATRFKIKKNQFLSCISHI